VTKGGGKELEEPLVVRPTSETIINHMFAQVSMSAQRTPQPWLMLMCPARAATSHLLPSG
jgi:hypothetical protein